MENKKVLLIDEDLCSYYIAREILKDHGISVIHAPSANIAFKSFLKTSNIEAIITEILLPQSDGFEVLKKIKSINASIPVIAQTASDYPGMKQKCLSAGFDDYIPKPVDFDLFIKKIMKILHFQETGIDH